MTKNTTYLLGILLTILAGSYFFYRCCSECGKGLDTPAVDTSQIPPAEANPTSFPFTISNGAYSYKVNDNFNFNVSSNTILDPLSEKVSEGVSGLAIFLSENKGKAINITGHYKSNEDNPTAFPNLGVARANAVKNHLVSQGIAASQINIFGKLSDEMIPSKNIYLGPITFEILGETEDGTAELQALYEKIKAAPLVLYFDTGETTIQLTPEERQKVADISRYLDKVEGAVCSIVGHTDNTGNRDANRELGLNRASFAKSYFVQNGISEAKITISSQGKDAPIASNATEEGKAKNRRTVVSLN